jgi:hypothetical protein
VNTLLYRTRILTIFLFSITGTIRAGFLTGKGPSRGRDPQLFKWDAFRNSGMRERLCQGMTAKLALSTTHSYSHF